MKRFAIYGTGAVCLLAVVAVAGLVSGRATAQTLVRAILVKNVDERGRIPYQESRPVACGGPEADLVCEIPFSPVPAGKRLVIEYIGGRYLVSQPITSAPWVEFRICRFLSGCPFTPTTVLPISRMDYQGGFAASVSSPVVLYVDEAGIPNVIVTSQVLDTLQHTTAVFTLSGYLIDKSQ